MIVTIILFKCSVALTLNNIKIVVYNNINIKLRAICGRVDKVTDFWF